MHCDHTRGPLDTHLNVSKECQNMCSFLFDRFKLICDGASTCAMAGNYTIDDEILVRSKAKTILDCYIESLLPPKVQVCIRIVK